MRGDDIHQHQLYRYVSAEQRIPPDHCLPIIRRMTDTILRRLSPRFDRLCARIGRPLITPGKLLRGSLLQCLYSVRSERC